MRGPARTAQSSSLYFLYMYLTTIIERDKGEQTWASYALKGCLFEQL